MGAHACNQRGILCQLLVIGLLHRGFQVSLNPIELLYQLIPLCRIEVVEGFVVFPTESGALSPLNSASESESQNQM